MSETWALFQDQKNSPRFQEIKTVQEYKTRKCKVTALTSITVGDYTHSDSSLLLIHLHIGGVLEMAFWMNVFLVYFDVYCKLCTIVVVYNVRLCTHEVVH